MRHLFTLFHGRANDPDFPYALGSSSDAQEILLSALHERSHPPWPQIQEPERPEARVRLTKRSSESREKSNLSVRFLMT